MFHSEPYPLSFYRRLFLEMVPMKLENYLCLVLLFVLPLVVAVASSLLVAVDVDVLRL